jgi:uncharacterized protein YdaU (DUF1376 family)
MRLNALWWWIDRWRKSTAYTDMTLEEQGAYRNLLDECNLRGGPIPNDERILAKACGDALAWPSIRDRVLARFQLTEHGWRHETLDEVLEQSQRRMTKQQRYRSKVGHRNGNGGGNEHGNAGGYPDPSPSPLDVLKDQERHVRAPLARGSASAPRDGFDAFWAVYPRKRSRSDAEKAWRKLAPSPELCQRILDAVAVQRTDPRWLEQDGRFIPYPATWLHGRRWEDAVEIERPAQMETRRDCRHDPPCPSTQWHRILLAREHGEVA